MAFEIYSDWVRTCVFVCVVACIFFIKKIQQSIILIVAFGILQCFWMPLPVPFGLSLLEVGIHFAFQIYMFVRCC